jgi:PAS domain S-box-containing protein
VERTTDDGVAAMLQLSPDAVLVVDQHGWITRANELAARLFRVSIDVLTASSVDMLVPEDVQLVHAAHRRAFHAAPTAGTMGWGRELRARRPDGTQFPVDISLQPVEVAGRPHILAVVRDVSAHHELRHQNRRLAADADALRGFVSMAGHELRTPLTSVRGFAETLLHRAELRDSPMAPELLQRIVRNSERQEALIAGLLDVSRIQGGALRVDATRVDLVGVVREVVAAFGADLEARLELPDRLVVVADRIRVEQVLVNLLTNALRYGAPPVDVALSTEGGEAVLSVTDHGPGVPEDFRELLFEPFQQASTGDRREAIGLGLGLHVASEVLQAMHGSIQHRQEAPGATFVVRLPLVQDLEVDLPVS